MKEALTVAIDLAYQAGKIMQLERNGRLRIDSKPDRTLVTNVDTAIQELAIGTLSSCFPDYYIQGEERNYGDPQAERVWVVDPLDGTGEYIEGSKNGLETYGFGLAAIWRNFLEIGLFYCPPRDELFVAGAGLGAYLNGVPLAVSQDSLQYGANYDYCHWDGAQPDTTRLKVHFGTPLGNYSAIYQACSVAKGESVFAAFPGNTLHDIAPGALIVQEARGAVTDIYGRTPNWRGTLNGSIYSNGLDHQTIVSALR